MAYVFRRQAVRRPARKLMLPVPPILAAVAGAYSLSGGPAKIAGQADAGNYSVIASPAVFGAGLTVTTGGYAVSGVSTVSVAALAAGNGSYASAGQPATFASNVVAAGGAYAIAAGFQIETISLEAVSGAYAVTGFDSFTPIVMRAGAGDYALAPGRFVLARTGGEYDQVYGGIGHYLEELERARQAARITRPTPRPIVREMRPQFKTVAVASPAPPPAVEFQLPDARQMARQQAAQREASEQAAQRQALLMRRRRQEAEVLLLAC